MDHWMKRIVTTMRNIGSLIAITVLSIPHLAKATLTLPSPGYIVQFNLGSDPERQFKGSTPQSASGINGNIAASGTTSPIPNPTLTGAASGGPQPGPGLSGAVSELSEITWSFEVVGPSGIPVPVIVAGNAGVNATNTNGLSFEATALITPDGGGVLTGGACLAGGTSYTCPSYAPSSSFSMSRQFFVSPNSVIGMGIDVGLTIANNPTPGANLGTITGYVDPVVTIDPAFAQASQYTLVLSPGIGNSSTAAPEPASLLLMISALAAFPLLRRGKA
jgi:hypothetical protein